MAFNEQEKQIIQYGAANGKSRQEVEAAIGRLRSGLGPVKQEEAPKEEPGFFSRVGQDFADRRQALKESADRTIEGKQSVGEQILQNVGNVIGGATDIVVEGVKSLTPQPVKDAASAVIKPIAETVAQSKPVQDIVAAWEKASPREKANIEAAWNVASIIPFEKVLGLVGKGIAKATEETIAVGSKVATAAKDTAVGAMESVKATGAGQYASELVDRVPRFINKTKEAAQEAKVRGELIRNSPAPVQEAIKTGVDQRVINTVVAGDAPTRQAYKEMVDIAENTVNKDKGVLKIKERPEIVAGKAGGEQYKLIDAQRKKVGQELGDAVEKLSTTERIDIQDSLKEVDQVLAKEGVFAQIDEKGVRLNFSGSKFTPAERTRIKELYNLAYENGKKLTPKQIHNKDSLFSKLQRESRFDGIGDILVDTGQGKSSLFRVFRDVFSENLDSISPEIRGLNRQYRNLATFTDDIENSIIKRGKFEATRDVDPSEFIQTNLRRALSDAQSATDYREIVREMDRLSRELGYKGANPEDLITFAAELRKLYPETVPANSFSGGIKTSLTGLAEKALDIGKPGEIDKQRALKALIESYLK